MNFLILMIMYLVTPSNNKLDSFVLEHQVRTPLEQKKGKAPALILLHGVGSNEQDLFSLSQYIDKSYYVISVRAPYVVSANKFKWYTVDFSTGKPEINFFEAEKSREKLLLFLDQIVEHYDIDADKIILGGFSQGAIMSFSIGLTAPEKLKGIACFSGRTLEEIKLKIGKAELKDSLKVFIAHGKQDRVLSFQYALESKAYFENLGAEVSFQPDNSGHSISRKHLDSFLDWMKKLSL